MGFEVTMNNLNNKFTESAKKDFSFLITNYSMDLVESTNEACVRYQSCISWLEIWYDRFSLFVNIGLLNSDLHESLWAIKLFKTGEARSVSYIASNEEALGKGINRLADYVKLYCNEALTGDIDFYKKMRKELDDTNAKSELRNKINDIESRAKMAWDNKDYRKEVELYDPLQQHLTQAQEKRRSICIRLLQEKETSDIF